jgi:hypothetical protein
MQLTELGSYGKLCKISQQLVQGDSRQKKISTSKKSSQADIKHWDLIVPFVGLPLDGT